MSRGALAALVGFVCLIVGVGIGIYLVKPQQVVASELAAKKPLGPSDAVTVAEERVRRLEGEFDSAMSDLYETPSPDSYRPDPALAELACNNAEMLELSCRKYGSACEESALARKQCESFSK